MRDYLCFKTNPGLSQAFAVEQGELKEWLDKYGYLLLRLTSLAGKVPPIYYRKTEDHIK